MNNFDARGSSRARDDAEERVESGASPEWKIAADECIYQVAILRPQFTTDAVVALLDRTGLTTRDLRALGPAMRRAERDGYAERIEGEFVRTVRVSRHRAPIQIWRSLIYKAPTRE